MPAPLARGIIIAASVIVAAGIAAYENPQFREWLDRSREKIAVAFQSTLDDLRPPRPSRDDPSMREDQDEKAEERRRKARQEILERGKKMEELQRRRTKSNDNQNAMVSEKRSPSFDTLIDDEGNLRSSVSATVATTSAIEAQDITVGGMRSRHVENHSTGQEQGSPALMHQSVDAPMLLRHLDGQSSAQAEEPWESRYEREMRDTWNLPLPSSRTPTASTHPSESLVDLTPTTENFPDPDYSVPSLSDAGSNRLDRTEYFSIPPQSSRASRSATLSVGEHSDAEYYYAHPSSPLQPIQPRQNSSAPNISAANNGPGSSAASVAGSTLSHDGVPVAHLSDFESEDDGFSEFGDGIRTPASAWTEVGSTFSTDGEGDGTR